MQQQRGHSNSNPPRLSSKTRFELSLQKVRKHLMPKKLHLRTDLDIDSLAKVPPTNKHSQSTKNKSTFKQHLRQKSDIDRTVNVNSFLFKDQSHKPSKRHSLKDDIHHVSINRSTFINRKGSVTKNNSIDKITRKDDLSPYKNSVSKHKVVKPTPNIRSRQPSGKLRHEKLKTQESRDEEIHKQVTLKTTPESYNLINTASKPKDVIGRHANHISMFEQAEILEYEIIYFLSKNPPKDAKGESNLGFDDDKGRYICGAHDHVAYRYEILEELGKGSFGHVYRAVDHKHKCHVALKIIRNKKTPNSQARIQYGILKYIRQADEQNCINVVQVIDAFQFRRHFCMTFELLSYNLYQLIKLNKFLPLSGQLIRRISIQVLSTLLFLYKHSIIHCDIKPQNILLKSSDKSGIKMIDFGSSCFADQKMYTYIQSRYYRAPEVILGLDYSVEIDMWSFGCVAAELKLSYPIFSGEDQAEQVGLIAEVIGLPDEDYYGKTQIGNNYFGKGAKPLRDREGIEIQPKTRLLSNLFPDPDFADFLSQIFVWDPKNRITPLEALRHRWITKGLPAEIRRQHTQYLAEQQKQLQRILKKRAFQHSKQPFHSLSEQLLAKALSQLQ